MYLFKGLISKLYKYQKRTYNTYGYYEMSLDIESGRQDGKIKSSKYYLMFKKIYSKRFSTDCFSGFFNEKSLRSKLGINDLQEFASEKASFEEMLLENSYFFNDLVKIKDKIRNKTMEKVKKITSIVLAILFIVGSIAFITSVFKPKKDTVIRNDSTNTSSPVEYISFTAQNRTTFEELSFLIEEGTTWNEFCEMQLSSCDFYVLGKVVYCSIANEVYRVLKDASVADSVQVLGNSQIIANIVYGLYKISN